MSQNEIPPEKALLIVFLFIGYIVIAVIIMRCISNWQGRKREQYRQDAMQNGRQVTAYLERYTTFSSESKKKYHGGSCTGHKAYYYYFSFPGGKRRSVKFVFYHTPADEITLYLNPSNPRKFYTEGEILRGKGNRLLIGFFFLVGFILLGLLGKTML